ncbi:MAG: universal stress protein [Planctomycetota bacterium]|jgi:nucleotide-binding universal stress UspA family protein
MYPFKRLLVGLDLTGRERSTLEYAAKAVEMTEPRRVFFCHVASRSDILDEVILERHPELMKTLDESVYLEEMKALVAEQFGAPKGPELRFDVVRGNPLDGLLRYAVDKDIDMMIVGSKSGNRVLPEKLARSAHCSILLIPEGTRIEKFRVLVPVDFSELCAEAVKVALSSYRVGKAERLVFLHAYRVPDGYHKIGKSHREFTGIMEDHGRKACAEFLAEFDLEGVNVKTEFREESDVSRAVIDRVKESGANLIVIGARGRTVTASFLLGSVTEKLIRNSFVPVLAVKKKGANLGFLEALLEHS